MFYLENSLKAIVNDLNLWDFMAHLILLNFSCLVKATILKMNYLLINYY